MRKYGYVTSIQERQMLAMRDFYPKERKLRVIHEPTPLEKTRLYEPFDIETVRWLAKQFKNGGSLTAIVVKFGNDGETGRGYIEF
jgi:hypothetical protein